MSLEFCQNTDTGNVMGLDRKFNSFALMGKPRISLSAKPYAVRDRLFAAPITTTHPYSPLLNQFTLPPITKMAGHNNCECPAFIHRSLTLCLHSSPQRWPWTQPWSNTTVRLPPPFNVPRTHHMSPISSTLPSKRMRPIHAESPLTPLQTCPPTDGNTSAGRPARPGSRSSTL